MKNDSFCRARAGLTRLIATMREEYLQAARNVIGDPNVLVNAVSTRVKQLKRGSRPLVESLEKLSLEDIALRELAEGKISYELAAYTQPGDPDRPRETPAVVVRREPAVTPTPVHAPVGI